MEVLCRPITTLQQAEQLAAVGVHHPINTLVMGRVYDIASITIQSHDIFLIVKINYQDKFIIIRLPQKCHENLKNF